MKLDEVLTQKNIELRVSDFNQPVKFDIFDCACRHHVLSLHAFVGT